MTLPSSDSRFESDYPTKDLTRLIALDANVYGVRIFTIPLLDSMLTSPCARRN